MSTLRADTIQNTSGGAVTLTNQEALKAYGVFDMSDNTIVDSFNIASYTDRATGSLYGNYTNSMSSVAHVVTASSGRTQEGSLATTDDNRYTVANSDTSGRYASNTSTVSTHSTKDDDPYIAGMIAGDLA